MNEFNTNINNNILPNIPNNNDNNTKKKNFAYILLSIIIILSIIFISFTLYKNLTNKENTVNIKEGDIVPTISKEKLDEIIANQIPQTEEGKKGPYLSKDKLDIIKNESNSNSNQAIIKGP